MLDFSGFGTFRDKKEAPLSWEVSGASGKLAGSVSAEVSDTDGLIAHLLAKDKVAFGLTVMDGTHGLSIGTERPQTQPLPGWRRIGFDSVYG
jgi:hypothetical protein